MTKLSTKVLADTINAKLEAPEEEEEDITTIKLDGDDTVRLENVILKQHVEQLTRQLSETLEKQRQKEAEDAIGKVQDDYQNYLAEKYDIDVGTHRIRVDAKSYTLSVIPLGE